MRPVLLALALASAPAVAPVPARAQEGGPPAPAQRADVPWYPSPYGPDDEAGAAGALLTPDAVRLALGLVTEGRVYALGLPLDEDAPAYPPRGFQHVLVENLGTGRSNHDDLVSGWLNVGTQLDGLAHAGADGVFYNGFRAEDIARADGLAHLGVENVPPIVARGVLLDVAALRGVARLGPGDVVSVADLEGALARQRLALRTGDVVLLHTGWLSVLAEDPAAYVEAQPGPDAEAAAWLAERGAVAVGNDTPRFEVVPNPDPDAFFPAHHTLLGRHGVYLLENVDTRALVADGVDEFLFVLAPLPVTGASQTVVNPLAIR